MKKLLHFFEIVLAIISVIGDIVEITAIPALFVIIGLLNSYPFAYYAITVGGYIILFTAVELILHFVCKALDKKYTPLIERKLKKIFKNF